MSDFLYVLGFLTMFVGCTTFYYFVLFEGEGSEEATGASLFLGFLWPLSLLPVLMFLFVRWMFAPKE